jgi:type IX secretion system PorP/SprF family membrane protein
MIQKILKIIKKCIHRLLWIVIYLSCYFSSFAQDFQYSLYHFTPLNLNPAMVAADDDQDASFIYRAQKLGNEIGLRSNQLNITHPLISKRGRWAGIGLLVSDDRAGESSFFIKQSIAASFAYNLYLNKFTTLSFGMQAGYNIKRISSEGLRTGSQWNGSAYDPGLPSGETFLNFRSGTENLNTGFVFRKIDKNKREISTFGFALGNITNPTEDFIAAPSKTASTFVFHGRQVLFSSGSVNAGPQLLYTNRARSHFYNIGANVNYSLQDFSLGILDNQGSVDFAVGYINEKAAALSFTLNQPSFKFGFSYDLDFNPQTEVRPFRGATEFAIQYRRTFESKYSKKKKIVKTKRYKKKKAKSVAPKTPQPKPEKSVNKKPDSVVEEPESKGTEEVISEKGEEKKTMNADDFLYKIMYFDFNKSLLEDKDATKFLDNLAVFLEENPDLIIKVIGHTDNIGKDNYNIKLSFKRAQTVSEYLNKKGIDKYRIIIEGTHSYNPMLPNDTENNRAKNRRVEIVPVNN